MPKSVRGYLILNNKEVRSKIFNATVRKCMLFLKALGKGNMHQIALLWRKYDGQSL